MAGGRFWIKLGCSVCLIVLVLLEPRAVAQPARPVYTFEEAELEGAAFSPTDRLLATWSSSMNGKPGRIALWDLVNGKEQRVLTGHGGDAERAAFSPDGTRLAAISSDPPRGAACVWEVKTGRLLLRLSGEEEKAFLHSLTFSPDGKSLITGNLGGEIAIWNLATQKVLTFHKCESDVNSLAFSPDGRFLAAGCKDGTVWVWGDGGREKGRKLRAHNQEVSAVVFSPDSKTLISGSEDGTFLVWKPEEWKIAKAVQTGLQRVFCLAFRPDGKTLVVGGDIPFPPGLPLEKTLSGCVEFYRAEQFDKILKVGLHPFPVFSVDVSRDGKWLTTAGNIRHDANLRTAKVWKIEELLRAERQGANSK